MIADIQKFLGAAQAKSWMHVCTMCLSPLKHDTLKRECHAWAAGTINTFMGIEVRVHDLMPDDYGVFFDSHSKIIGVISFKKPE